MKMSFMERLGIVGALSVIAVFLALIIGWAMNLYTLVVTAASGGDIINWAMFILRIVGVFIFPVGGVAGYF